MWAESAADLELVISKGKVARLVIESGPGHATSNNISKYGTGMKITIYF